MYDGPMRDVTEGGVHRMLPWVHVKPATERELRRVFSEWLMMLRGEGMVGHDTMYKVSRVRADGAERRH